MQERFTVAGTVSPEITVWTYNTINKMFSDGSIVKSYDIGLDSNYEHWQEIIERTIREEMDGKFTGGYIGGLFQRSLVLVQLKCTGCLPNLKKFAKLYLDTIISLSVEGEYNFEELFARSFTNNSTTDATEECERLAAEAENSEIVMGIKR